MDIQEFWEANKRWVLGALLGFVVFMIARQVVANLYDPTQVRAALARTVGELNRERYGSAALRVARGEGEALEQQLAALRQALEFHPGAGYLLAAGEPHDQQYLRAQARMLERFEELADVQGVDLARTDVRWTPPVTREEHRATMVGLSLMDAVVEALFAAHSTVRAADPQAPGLRAVLSLGLERRSGTSGAGMRPVRRRGGFVDASRFLREEVMTFSFEADTATTLLWLESCRIRGMALSELTVTGALRPGDPTQIKGRMAAVTFDEEAFNKALSADEGGA